MRAIIVIPATDQAQASADLDAIVGGIVSTFDVPLVDAQEQLAAYWCGITLTDEQWAVVQVAFNTDGRRAFGESWTADCVLDVLGLSRPESKE